MIRIVKLRCLQRGIPGITIGIWTPNWFLWRFCWFCFCLTKLILGEAVMWFSSSDWEDYSQTSLLKKIFEFPTPRFFPSISKVEKQATTKGQVFFLNFDWAILVVETLSFHLPIDPIHSWFSTACGLPGPIWVKCEVLVGILSWGYILVVCFVGQQWSTCDIYIYILFFFFGCITLKCRWAPGLTRWVIPTKLLTSWEFLWMRSRHIPKVYPIGNYLMCTGSCPIDLILWNCWLFVSHLKVAKENKHH